YSTSAPVGPGDADIFVNLTADHAPTAGYVRLLRSKLRALYPSTSFAFLPADMVSQILNFGLPAPIDVQVSGFNAEANRAYAQALLARLHRIPGVVDLRIQQAFDYPQLNVEVDRSKAALLGLSETDVASDLLVSLSGSSQTTLSFWIDPKRGSQVAVHGQVKTMTESFAGLLLGLAAAIVLVYLLIVVNFQSWLDPFIIITALPAALAGIVWMLFLSHTPVSVPALTGAIMCMGVATANSVLVVSFARDRMNVGDDAAHAAVQAGVTRFRPVLMTALAMIIGMVPMALGLGEGGEQNAPLGRAVIGGLIFATVATLFFVPTVFKLVHGRRST